MSILQYGTADTVSVFLLPYKEIAQIVIRRIRRWPRIRAILSTYTGPHETLWWCIYFSQRSNCKVNGYYFSDYKTSGRCCPIDYDTTMLFGIDNVDMDIFGDSQLYTFEYSDPNFFDNIYNNLAEWLLTESEYNAAKLNNWRRLNKNGVVMW